MSLRSEDMVPLMVDMEVTNEEFSGLPTSGKVAKPWRGIAGVAVGAAFMALAFVGVANSSWPSKAVLIDTPAVLLEQGTLKPAEDSHVVCTCDDGWVPDALGKTCIDYNACTPSTLCAPTGKCVDDLPPSLSYTCSCLPGYEYADATKQSCVPSTCTAVYVPNSDASSSSGGVKLYDSNGLSTTETTFNSAARAGNGILKRTCADCPSSHQTIFYKRLNKNDWNPYQLLLVTWASANNQVNVDMALYSTYSDAVTGTNAWSFCNYDDTNIAFPRDCGPTGYVPHTWSSLSRGGKAVAWFTTGGGALTGKTTNTRVVTCNNGYAPVSTVVTCSGKGVGVSEWDNVPTCKPTKCSTLTIDNSNIGATSPAANYVTGDSLTVQCNGGYFVDGLSSTCSFQAACVASGPGTSAWSGAGPKCVAASCPALTVANSDAIAVVKVIGKSASITCQPGYGLQQTTGITCQAASQCTANAPGASWSATPQCPILTCPNLVVADSASLGGAATGTIGDSRTVTCASGFQSSANAGTCTVSRSCSSVAAPWGVAWSGDATCSLIPCPAWTPIANALSEVKSGDYSVLVTCMNGFGVSSTDTSFASQCVVDGCSRKWTNVKQCFPLNCPALSIANSNANQVIKTTGQTATVTCNNGYGVKGSAAASTYELKCAPTGPGNPSWPAVLPSCPVVTCETLTVDSSDTTGFIASTGETRTVACGPGQTTSTGACSFAVTCVGIAPGISQLQDVGDTKRVQTCSTAAKCPTLLLPNSNQPSVVGSTGAEFDIQCKDGYTATRCTSWRVNCRPTTACLSAWDPPAKEYTCSASSCAPGMCQNGGSCSESAATFGVFTCSCQPGYTGTLCETGIECTGAGYTGTAGQCTCASGYGGSVAYTNGALSGCAPKPCASAFTTANSVAGGADTKSGAAYIFACNAGFVPSGVATCTLGVWDSPTCKDTAVAGADLAWDIPAGTQYGYNHAAWTSAFSTGDATGRTAAWNAVCNTVTGKIGEQTVTWKHNLGKPLHQIFSGAFVASTLGQSAWSKLGGGAYAVQPHCNMEGFNVNIPGWVTARFGIGMNQENECRSPDTLIGFGLNRGSAASNAGGSCGCCNTGGRCAAFSPKAQLYVADCVNQVAAQVTAPTI